MIERDDRLKFKSQIWGLQTWLNVNNVDLQSNIFNRNERDLGLRSSLMIEVCQCENKSRLYSILVLKNPNMQNVVQLFTERLYNKTS